MPDWRHLDSRRGLIALDSAPRVRFAPSPTGFFHVGSARTALFNYLVARHLGGTFLLRIEDTDDNRNREEWVTVILECLDWLGLNPDAPFERQSDHATEHRAAADALFAAGYCYACACTPEEVQARKGDDKTPGYDGFCRDRGVERGPTTALRFKVDRSTPIVVDDRVRGPITFEGSALEDFVVARSSGAALYLLANVVDDRRDGITQVVRGEDHISNTPKQLLLWRALNACTEVVAEPVYAHLPLLVNEQRKKLSKRRDPVSVVDFRDQGFLAEAFVNFLGLLGWSPGEEEFATLADMVERFELADVNRSPAYFDVAKLTSMNGDYLRALSPEGFLHAVQPWVDPQPGQWAPAGATALWPAGRFDAERFAAIAPLVQSRVATLAEVPAMVDFLFTEEPPVDPAAFDKAVGGDPDAAAILDAALLAYAEGPFDAAALHAATLGFGEALGLKLRRVQAPIRVAITGKLIGPPLFESLAVLGRDEVLRRLTAMRARVA